MVKRLTSAQVMISQFESSSPVLGSVLTPQNLEPASDSLSLSLSLSLSKINILNNVLFRTKCNTVTNQGRVVLSPPLT